MRQRRHFREMKAWARESSDYSLRSVVWITLVLKGSILALLFAGHYFLPFNTPTYEANFVYPKGEAPELSTAFKTWDAQHYLFLAEKGYAPHQTSNAFYPLFPLLIRISGFLFLNSTLIAGLLISNLLAVVSTVYMYLIAVQFYGRKTAFFSCLLLLSFPTSFYSGLIYAESLFLALATALFYYLGQSKTVQAGLCSFLLPLTRPTGILVVLPALVELFAGKKEGGRSVLSREFLIPLCFAVGLGFYLAIMKISTGNYFSGFAAQAYFLADNKVANFLHPFDWFMRNFIHIEFSFNGIQTSLLNRTCFVAMLVSLYMARKVLKRPLFVYTMTLGVIPAMSGDLVSYIRYAAVLFPLFIFLAVKLGEKARYYFVAGLVLQGSLALAHSLNFWVA